MPYEGKLNNRGETEAEERARKQDEDNPDEFKGFIVKDVEDSDDSSDGKQDAPPMDGELGEIGETIQKLSSKKEGGDYQGFLSYAAEWHSLVLGLGVGLAATPDVQSALIAYSLGRGTRGQFSDNPHVRDVAKEPAYAIAGLAVGNAFRGGLNLSQFIA